MKFLEIRAWIPWARMRTILSDSVVIRNDLDRRVTVRADVNTCETVATVPIEDADYGGFATLLYEISAEEHKDGNWNAMQNQNKR